MRRGRTTIWLVGVTTLTAGFVVLVLAGSVPGERQLVSSGDDGISAGRSPLGEVPNRVADFLSEPMAFMDELLREQARATEECLAEAGSPVELIDRAGLVNPDPRYPPLDAAGARSAGLHPAAAECVEALESNEARLSEGITLAADVLALGVDGTGARTSSTPDLVTDARRTTGRSRASLYEEVQDYVAQ